jgi:WD40 repeat protein
MKFIMRVPSDLLKTNYLQMKNKINLITLIVTFILINVIQAQTIDWSKKANPSNLSINGVAFKADGQKVLSGTNCHPASIRMFDVSTSNLDWDYNVGMTYMCIMGVTFSSNSNYIAAIEEFGNIFIFDNTGPSPVIVDTINTGTSYAFSTAISPSNDKVAVGCSNGKLKIYNIPSSTLAVDITAHSNWVTSVAYSPDGTKIVTGGSDDKVKIWSNTGTLLFTCNGHAGDITCVKVTPDNNYVVSSSKDDKIKVWNISTGTLVQTISGHTADVNGIDISPDGSKIVSVSSDSTCKIWNFNSGSLLSTFGVADSGAVNAVAWSPNGDKIVTGNVLSDVVLWSVPSNLGINDYSNVNEIDLTIFPNPANDLIHLNIPKNLKIEKTEITDLTGKIVFSSNQNENIIPINHLPSGFYFLSIQTQEKKKAIQSFIKN